MSEYRYKYQGELNDAGKIVCVANGCDDEAGPCMHNLCREHFSLAVSCPGGTLRLKPEHPSTANATYTIAHGFYAVGPKGTP